MMSIKILKTYLENTTVGSLEFEFDKKSNRPAWIFIKTPKFKARFITIQTKSNAEILYKRFTGNFYYPVDLVLQPDEEKRFYDKYAQFYDDYTIKNNLPMAKFLLDKINKHKILKNTKILDVGAGTGIFSDLAAIQGFTDLTLVDINKSMLNMAKKKTPLLNAKFITGDVETIKLPKIYDLVVGIMMFDVLSNSKIENTLKNITSYLSKKSFIFLVEDKRREIYLKYFDEIESGFLNVSKEKDFKKYFFIGKIIVPL